MALFGLHHELKHIGATLNRWQAEAQGFLWLAAALGGLWLLALTDLFLRYERAGRLVAFGFIAIILGAGLRQIFAALSRKGSIQAIAARIEHAFPALDNYLINVVQFEARGLRNPLEAAYVERGVPGWHLVNVKAMRNRRELFRGLLLLVSAGLLLILPGFWTGAAWTNSLSRILNPFSTRPPTTLATLHQVTPGNAAVLIGDPLTLACEASGKKGQEVFLELWPADDKKSIRQLSRIVGNERQAYSYHLDKLTTGLQYRFRAGDAISERYTILALVPLAFNQLAVTVTPPAYTRLEIRSFDALFDTVPIPQGSLLTATLNCNRELRSAALMISNAEAISLASADDGKTWKGQFTLAGKQQVIFNVQDTHQTKLETTFNYDLLPDKPPTIRVVAPTAKTVLAPGAVPGIQFEVTDDFGITSVHLEKIDLDEKNPAPPIMIRTWAVSNGLAAFASNWTGAAAQFNLKEPLAFRLVAMDNCAADKPQRAESAPIIFERNSADEIQAQLKSAAAAAAASLNKLVELQHANLEKTKALDAAASAAAPPWQDAAAAQAVILKLAGQLIANPGKPLGPLTEPVRSLHRGAMQEAVDVLQRIPQAEPARRPELSQQAVKLETRILRILMRLDEGLDKVKQHRQLTGLLPLLEALVKRQETALDHTRTCISQPAEPSETLVQQQDRLATDTDSFVSTCRADAQTQSANDKEFSALLTQIADGMESKKISANMLRAAEKLQNKAPAQAIPPQTEALEALKEFCKILNEWRVNDAEESMAELSDALQAAGEKLDKLAKIETKALEALRETSRQEDKDNKKTDKLDEDFSEELKKIHENTEDALLEIATDLQIFTELPVGNDLVEDVFQVFEDCKQQTGSEKTTTGSELGLQKEDSLQKNIEALQGAKDRIDDTEAWLGTAPKSKKLNMESFDQQEMAKYPVIPMPAEMEDIIGDLLSRETEVEKDSASNQGVADMLAGWDTQEGEQSLFSAKGKSGNQPPAHKEQDGRGNIGRQGMSDGETTAGSGKVNEGDEKIEKRMTQDPSQSGQVEEDGHAKAKATGGGKQSGFSEELGMSGSGPRRDSNSKQGSELGLQAMLRRNTQAIYARAQLSHLRTGSLDEVIRHMQQAENAIATGAPIMQVREFQRLAIAALKKTQTELGADVFAELDPQTKTPVVEEDQLAGARDEAPANYRDMVSEYFKTLTVNP